MSYQEQYLDRAYHYRDVRVNKRLLGTFGFRGVVNDTITGEQAFRFGSALGKTVIADRGGVGTGLPEDIKELPRVVIGQDTRTSSDMLKCALAGGLMQQGVGAVDVGNVPPGGLSREILIKEASAGVMITASHNPPQYNGIKVMGASGRGFTPDEDIRLEKMYFSDDASDPLSAGGEGKPARVGTFTSDPNALSAYVESMSEFVSGLYPDGQGVKVVVDGGGGNASNITPKVTRDFGCGVVEYNCEYDGEFTLRPSEPSPENLAKLSELVRDNGADFGVGHDGDSDRTNFVDGDGRFIQGDRTATILLVELFEKMRSGGLTEPVIPVNVAFSDILEDVAGKHGFQVLYTPVGEPAIAEAMDMYGAGLGAEEMGSLVIKDWSWSREGPVLVPLMAGILKEKAMSLAELDATYPEYHQVKSGMEMEHEVFTGVKDSVAPKLREMDLGAKRVIDIDGVRVFMEDGWFMVRASGTEPKFRIFSESKEADRAKTLNEQGHELLRKCME